MGDVGGCVGDVGGCGCGYWRGAGRQPRGSGGAAYLASTGRIYLVGGCLSSLRDSSASVLRFVSVWVCRYVGVFMVCSCVAVVEWLWGVGGGGWGWGVWP